MAETVTETRARIEAAVAGRTVARSFAHTVMRQGADPALRRRLPDGTWQEMTWAEYADGACRVAAALVGLGLGRGERVALMLRSRPEFHLADMGVVLAGATPLSIYHSSPPDQVAGLLGHSRAAMAVVEDRGFLDRVTAVRDRLPDLRRIICLEEPAGPSDVVPWASLLDSPPVALDEAAGAVTPDDLATVIYTSGTTGAPKGVMLSQRNMAFAVAMFSEVMGLSLRGLRAISYLPMAHIAERISTHYLHVTHGTVVSCCADLAALPTVMAEVHPNWWFCAPRLWEKLQAGIEGMVARDPVRAHAFREALALGARVRAVQGPGEPAGADLAAAWDQARHEVVRPVLAPLGLDEVAIAITGSAPIPRPTHEFFLHCGLPLSDCYGQSESSGLISWDPVDVVPGTSGRPFPGLEVRLADDGEVLARGPNVFEGYLDDPERTAEAKDADGWLHTGDIGRFDGGGNLVIVDRKKEIIVPGSGHNVSPAQLEAALKESSLIGQVCVVGDGRPFIAALVVLDAEGTAAFARREGLADLPLPDMARHPAVLAAIETDVALANQRFPRAEQVRAFRVLGDEWLPDSDVLTPTAKLKRRGVAARYTELIEELYRADA